MFYLYFELGFALCCVLRLKEISVNIEGIYTILFLSRFSFTRQCVLKMGFKVQVSENNNVIKQMQICDNGGVMRIYRTYTCLCIVFTV